MLGSHLYGTIALTQYNSGTDECVRWSSPRANPKENHPPTHLKSPTSRALRSPAEPCGALRPVAGRFGAHCHGDILHNYSAHDDLASISRVVPCLSCGDLDRVIFARPVKLE